jgi:hypothetical protein
MSIITQILGALTGGASKAGAGAATTNSPIAGIVEQLIGGQAGSQSLNGLVQKFEAAGLANVVQSWIGTGANLPIKPEQLQQALGAEHLTQLAQTAAALAGRLDVATMERLGIYAADGDSVEDVDHYFPQLQAYVGDAARQGHGLLIWMM